MLTVLIATRNGAHTLPRALSGYCQLTSPPGGWKLVVVDNGSTDSTKQIVVSFANRLPLTYQFEPTPGKNAALNAVLPRIEGDLIVFTDDDAVPRPDWLLKMRAAADARSSYSIFGGAAVPLWEVPPPEWILRQVRLMPVYSLTDPSWEDGPIAAGFVFGNNMAIRAQVFQAGHRFSVAIGPRGRSYAMGSETELILRLDKAGYQCWYCKEAVIEHIIRKFQMERSWILGRAVRFGRGRYRLAIHWQNEGRKQLFGVPGYLLRELRNKGVDVIRAKLRGDQAELFTRRWIFNYLLGQAIEARELYKEKQPSKPSA